MSKLWQVFLHCINPGWDENLDMHEEHHRHVTMDTRLCLRCAMSKLTSGKDSRTRLRSTVRVSVILNESICWGSDGMSLHADSVPSLKKVKTPFDSTMVTTD
jgi:hypothetical protein